MRTLQAKTFTSLRAYEPTLPRGGGLSAPFFTAHIGNDVGFSPWFLRFTYLKIVFSLWKTNRYHHHFNHNQKRILMTFFDHIDAFDRLHDLIKRRATGTPKQLAAKFNVSIGTIKNRITTLRDKNFPIAYSREDATYYYAYEIEVVIFQIKPK